MIYLFKKPPKEVTRLHPDLKKLIQLAFTLKDGKKKIKFYEFKEIHDMPAKRYESLNEFMEDNGRGMTKDELLHWSDQTLIELNKNNLEGLSNVRYIQQMIKQQMQLAIDIDFMMRILSCVFFFGDENLLEYDWDIGDYKIELFKKHGLESFFCSNLSANTCQ